MSKETGRKKKKIEHWTLIAFGLIAFDFVAIHLSYFIALWIRFDCRFSTIPVKYLQTYVYSISAYAFLAVGFFWLFRMYRSMWRYASYPELFRFAAGTVLASALYTIVTSLVMDRFPLSTYVGGAFFQAVLIIGIRFSYRFLLYIRSTTQDKDGDYEHVMLIGAGDAGQMILRDIRNTKDLKEKVVCVIDDNPNKWGRYMENVPIVGGRDDIFANVEKYQVKKIYIAIPSAKADARRDISNICKETGCELKQLPGMYQLVKGQVSLKNMKDVSIEDLLGRDVIKTDEQDVFDFINGKVILVTGGGGSIGSELCRQVAKHNPKQLIIFDVYENNAYDIQLELKEKYPTLNLEVLIGSVRDSRRMYQIFETYHPQVVYHAAAHKHVPLMEDSPNEAIKNNAIGTYKTAFAAMVHGCERFVLISTDKAVNPTNIMGASKRLCEMIIQSFDAKIKEGKAEEIPQLFTHYDSDIAGKKLGKIDYSNIKTEFVAVRFGNVLGSNGSVIPLFKKQIEHGGPVTVTHPDIVRYFMTIPEAVGLVMLAGTYAKGGEIFVLDMGTEVKIDTLARNLIKLSGHKPDVDIKIEYTGLRPGEKLYEEKLMAEEGLKKSPNNKIFIGCPIPFDIEEFLGQLKELMDVAYRNKDDIREYMQRVVSTYHPGGTAGASEEKAE